MVAADLDIDRIAHRRETDDLALRTDRQDHLQQPLMLLGREVETQDARFLPDRKGAERFAGFGRHAAIFSTRTCSPKPRPMATRMPMMEQIIAAPSETLR